MTVISIEEQPEFINNIRVDEIYHILDANDIERLRVLTFTQDGLVNSEIRSRAWPLLIGMDSFLDIYLNEISKQERTDIQHKDSEQVLKDVERSFISNEFESDIELQNLRFRLNRLILRVLSSIPGINYYQGYHDIGAMVILNFNNDDEAFKFFYILTLRYLRDHMMKGIEPTMKQLEIVPDLIKRLDHELYEVIELVKPVYSISPIITLFTHDIMNLNNLSIIWDFILSYDDPQLIIYIFVSMMLYYKEDIIMDLNELSDSSVNSKDSNYDLDLVHVVLTNFIRNHLNINSLDSKLEIYNILKITNKIKKQIPLKSLKSFKSISKFSFLKSKSTSLTILALQFEEFNKNEMKLRKRESKMKKLQNSKTIIKRRISKAPIIFKISLGVGILGIILHSTTKSGKFGIGNDFARNFITFWDCLRDRTLG